MINDRSHPNKVYLALIFIVGAFALSAQFYLNARNHPLGEAIVRYINYFTILTNLLVTVCAAVLLFKPKSALGNFFSRPSVLTATTVYIFVVGLIYNLLLRGVWDPQGLQKVVDNLLHVVAPLLFLFLWVIFVPKSNLSWNVFQWLIYPFIYGIYSIIWGFFTGFYPYFFIDVEKLGYPHVALNMFFLILTFLVLSLLFVGIGKLLTPKSRAH